jgi:hypothetical protein
MSKEKSYVIKNIRKFINKTRIIVYNNFGGWEDKQVNTKLTLKNKTEKGELDQILPFNESKSIILPLIKKEKNIHTSKVRYVINDQDFNKALMDLNSRMISNIIASLVNKGLIETAFDEKVNDFVFWVKDNENENLEKPETD